MINDIDWCGSQPLIDVERKDSIYRGRILRRNPSLLSDVQISTVGIFR